MDSTTTSASMSALRRSARTLKGLDSKERVAIEALLTLGAMLSRTPYTPYTPCLSPISESSAG